MRADCQCNYCQNSYLETVSECSENELKQNENKAVAIFPLAFELLNLLTNAVINKNLYLKTFEKLGKRSTKLNKL